jgi:hypothetical protein
MCLRNFQAGSGFLVAPTIAQAMPPPPVPRLPPLPTGTGATSHSILSKRRYEAAWVGLSMTIPTLPVPKKFCMPVSRNTSGVGETLWVWMILECLDAGRLVDREVSRDAAAVLVHHRAAVRIDESRPGPPARVGQDAPLGGPAALLDGQLLGRLEVLVERPGRLIPRRRRERQAGLLEEADVVVDVLVAVVARDRPELAVPAVQFDGLG